MLVSPPAAFGLSGASRRAADRESLPWIEKHRPQVLSDVVGNEDAVDQLKLIADSGNIPNLLLIGPPGTGKTTSIHCLVNQVYGEIVRASERVPEQHVPRALREVKGRAVREWEASASRNLAAVRSEVRDFAERSLFQAGEMEDAGGDKILKVAIFDEADNMSNEAQLALRRIMEKTAATTRFVFACNKSEAVIEQLQSHCAIIRFTKLSDANVRQRVQLVCEREGVSITDDGVEAIVDSADGDLRTAMNNLQSTHVGFGDVTAENVYRICSQPAPQNVRAIIAACLQHNCPLALDKLRQLYTAGYSTGDIMKTMRRIVEMSHPQRQPPSAIRRPTNPSSKTSPSSTPAKENALYLSRQQQLFWLREIGVTHMRFSEGLDTHLQMAGLVARVCLALSL